MTGEQSCPPVLFLIFRRPALTAQVFAAIRAAAPSRLYVAADGARAGVAGEAQACEQARKIIGGVDWPCEVRTLFRDENLGCKRAVSGALTWFFDQEPQGIVLEDDCLPHADFFRFCGEMLPRYAEDERVATITGDNFQQGRRRGDASYYFSRYPHCWGWATWRRAWKAYDGNIPFWPEWQASSDWRDFMPDPLERRYWKRFFDRVEAGEIDSWAYPWTACVWRRRGLTVTPNVNLVRNIGFGESGTHTTGDGHAYELDAEPLGPLEHAGNVVADSAADTFAFQHHFGGLLYRWPFRVLSLAHLALTGRTARAVTKGG